jgi:hypothetical protein
MGDIIDRFLLRRKARAPCRKCGGTRVRLEEWSNATGPISMTATCPDCGVFIGEWTRTDMTRVDE